MMRRFVGRLFARGFLNESASKATTSGQHAEKIIKSKFSGSGKQSDGYRKFGQDSDLSRWPTVLFASFASGGAAAGLTFYWLSRHPDLLDSGTVSGLEGKKFSWFPSSFQTLGAGAAAVAGVYSQGGGGRSTQAEVPSNGSNSASNGSPVVLSPHFIADAAAKAAPAVVNITVHQDRLDVPDWFGRFQDKSSGSGFIFGEDGMILTNYHVVAGAFNAKGGAHGQASLLVSLQDGRVFEGEVVNFDKASDLALVRINSDDALPTVKLGQSGNLRVGEWVVALGSPLHLRNSVTAGIISCVDRKAKDLGLTGSHGIDYIQTDAAINQGNSGGPLVNLAGEVIGVNNMKALAADGVSFAIPVDTAKEVITQLALQGRVLRPYLGIKMLPINPRVASQLRKLTPQFPDVSHGILVPEVTKGSPAERGGVKPGDVIVWFKGCNSDVTTTRLVEELGRHIGRGMEIRVLRRSVDGKQHLVTLHVVASRVEE